MREIIKRKLKEQLITVLIRFSMCVADEVNNINERCEIFFEQMPIQQLSDSDTV